MRKVEVVTYDIGTGLAVVDHVWKVTKRKGARKLGKTIGRAMKWAKQAAAFDRSTDHTVYVRSV